METVTLPSFSLWQAFPPSQIIFLVLFTLVLYFAAFASRPRLFVTSILPRPGDDISGFATLPPATATTETAQPDDEEKEPFLPTKAGPVADDGVTVGKRPYSTRLQTAGRAAAGLAIVLVDAWFVYAVCDSGPQVVLCTVLSLILAIPVGNMLWRVFGGVFEALSKKADGSIVSGLICSPASLHPSWMILFWLAGFAVFPSLALESRPLYFLLPLALLGHAAEPTGVRLKLRWALMLWVGIIAAIAVLFGVLGVILYFTTRNSGSPTGPVDGASDKPTDGSMGVWKESFSSRLWLAYTSEVLYLLSCAQPTVFAISCLYRFDRRPSPEEMARAMSGPKAVLLLPAKCSSEGEGRKILIANLPHVAWMKIQLLREGVRPTLTYSNLAVFIVVSLLAAAPVLPVYLLRELEDNFPATLIIAHTRGLVLAVSVPVMAPVVFALAWYRGEARQLWAYEEDWGVAPGAVAKAGADDETEVAALLE